jgi:ATP synthase F1 delta subunit
MRTTPAAAVYARAFLEASDAAKVTAKLLPLVGVLAGVLSEKGMALQLADPRFGPAMRRDLVKAIAAKLKLPELLESLLRVLADHKRLGEAGAVMAGIISLAHQRAGTAEVRVESAVKLLPAQVEGLKAVLKKKLGATDVLVEEASAPALLGGFRAFAAGSVWDCSVRGRLDALAAAFARVIDR